MLARMLSTESLLPPSSQKMLKFRVPASRVVCPSGPQRSMLLPELLTSLAEGESVSVLDLGPAMSDTVRFLSEYRCQLTFADIPSEVSVNPENLFDGVPERQFDIVLMWDMLNYFSDDALSGFIAQLSTFIHEQTLAHGIAVRDARSEIEPRRYALHDMDRFSSEAHPEAEFRQAHPQRILKSALAPFTIRRGTLLQDGRLELLFHQRKIACVLD